MTGPGKPDVSPPSIHQSEYADTLYCMHAICRPSDDTDMKAVKKRKKTKTKNKKPKICNELSKTRLQSYGL